MSGRSEVEVDALVKRFGAVTAVDGVSFAVEAGEMFGLIGPDGAGKTTTLRAVLGLLAPDAGSVRTCGREPARERRTVRTLVAESLPPHPLETPDERPGKAR